jgi:hypothetical protein
MGTVERLLGVAAFMAAAACGGQTVGYPAVQGTSSGGQAGQTFVDAGAGAAGTGGAAGNILPCDAVKSLPACQYYAAAKTGGVIALAIDLQEFQGIFLGSCITTLDEPPDDPNLVTVLVDCIVIPRAPPVDGGDGSYWVIDLDQKTLTLGGAICDRIKIEGVMRMDYVVTCPPGTP